MKKMKGEIPRQTQLSTSSFTGNYSSPFTSCSTGNSLSSNSGSTGNSTPSQN